MLIENMIPPDRCIFSRFFCAAFWPRIIEPGRNIPPQI